MGRIAESFASLVRRTKEPAARPHRRKRGPELDLVSLPSEASLLREGHSPLHARYIVAQHLATVFAEYAIEFPPFAPFREAAEDAEDEYLPSGPPMSPVTASFFTTWLLCDLRFGADAETLADCVLPVAHEFPIAPDRVEALRRLAATRMGVYLHEGWVGDGRFVRLRELVTRDVVTCEVPSGRLGEAGELWYVRVCPPLPEAGPHHLVFTTPYVLRSSRPDWAAYLRRSLVPMPGADDRARLHALLKYGPSPRAWPEFVMRGYHDHEPGAIHLAGIPDVPGSLPHA